MSINIPLVEFEVSERVPIEVIHRQSASIAKNPLASELLNSVLNYVFILNRHRQIVFASQNCKDLIPGHALDQLLGLRPGEALACDHIFGTKKSCGTTMSCQECGAAKAIIASLMGQRRVEECHLTRVINCQPEAVDLLINAIPFIHQGEQFSIVSIADISHQKRRQALERVFFHDLINLPGGLENLVQLVENPPKAVAAKKRLQTGLKQLLEEIQTQRDLDLAEKNQLRLNLQPTGSLDLLVTEAKRFKQHPAAARRQIQIDPKSLALQFECDPVLLQRMLGHLIKNALEAIPEDQAVTLSCQKDSQNLRFSVHNPGQLPPAVERQMFQRSFSTKGAGHGLGTYSVKLLAEKYLHGKAGVTSTPKQGTVFWFSIPLQKTKAASTHPRTRRPAGGATAV